MPQVLRHHKAAVTTPCQQNAGDNASRCNVHQKGCTAPQCRGLTPASEDASNSKRAPTCGSWSWRKARAATDAPWPRTRARSRDLMHALARAVRQATAVELRQHSPVGTSPTGSAPNSLNLLPPSLAEGCASASPRSSAGRLDKTSPKETACYTLKTSGRTPSGKKQMARCKPRGEERTADSTPSQRDAAGNMNYTWPVTCRRRRSAPSLRAQRAGRV